jgi:RND family efflux transporter MFP subunit
VTKSAPRFSPKVWLPLLVLAAGMIGTVGLVSVRPAVSTEVSPHFAPVVRVITAQARTVQLQVEAQGSVLPRTETTLVAEVSGRIPWVSPSLASGGFVAAGDELVHIDPSDYRLAVERASAALARAESALALGRSAAQRQRTLAERGVTSSAALDDSDHRERAAEAGFREAKVALEQAQHDLERTVVTAPFAGRVREKHVDLGQFVNRSTPIARIYAVDFAEIRLPISDDDAAFVDLPVAYRDEAVPGLGPQVTLSARFAGRDHSWQGRIVRTEGEIDPRTRMIHAVARVEDPYGRGEQADRPPLAVGMFVHARIEGRVVPDVIELPRSALRGRDEVVVADDQGRLHIRSVEILKQERDRVLVVGGLRAGERVCTPPPAVTVEGMEVRVLAAAPAPAPPARRDPER